MYMYAKVSRHAFAVVPHQKRGLKGLSVAPLINRSPLKKIAVAEQLPRSKSERKALISRSPNVDYWLSSVGILSGSKIRKSSCLCPEYVSSSRRGGGFFSRGFSN